MATDFSKRLKEASTKHAPAKVRGDKQAFQEAIKTEMGSSDKDRHGTSYPSVLSYFSGGSAPSLEWIQAAAGILGVRAEWLAFGSGTATEEEELKRLEVRGVSDAAHPRERRSAKEVLWLQAFDLKWDLLKGMGVNPPTLAQLPRDPNATEEALHAWAVNHNVHHIPHWVAPLAEVERRLSVDARDIGRALAAPLEALGLDIKEGLGIAFDIKPWLQDHITTMTPALLTLAPEIGRQKAASREESDGTA